MSLTTVEVRNLVDDFLKSFDKSKLCLRTEKGEALYSLDETNEAITRRLTPLLTRLCDDKVRDGTSRLIDAIHIKMSSIETRLLHESNSEMILVKQALVGEYASYGEFAQGLKHSG